VITTRVDDALGGADVSIDPGAGMTCRELVELVTEYFDGALPADVRAAFDEHVRLCPDCELYLEQMRSTVRLAGDVRELERRPEVTALLAEFREWRSR
jgi:hypothetical protein